MRKLSKEGIQVTNISWSAVTWFFSLLISIVYLAGVRTNGDNWKDTVNADGNGYYAYLPAAFIYGDFQYKFAPGLICEYNGLCKENGPYFCNKVNGRYVNKYFVGVSVAISPFWLPMSAVSSLGNYKHDGYSFVFKLSVSLAGLFYAFAALWVLRKILRRFLIEDHLIAVLIPLFYFGTNLFHYTLHEPSMSHVYSFAFVTFFLWQWCRVIDNYNRKRFSLLGLLFGMVLIIRPTNAVILLLLPFFAGSWPATVAVFRNILRDFKGILLMLFCFAIPVFLQLLVYKLQSDNW